MALASRVSARLGDPHPNPLPLPEPAVGWQVPEVHGVEHELDRPYRNASVSTSEELTQQPAMASGRVGLDAH